MKSISIFSMLIVALNIISCDNKDQTVVNRVTGNWKISEVRYSARGSSLTDSIVTYDKAQFNFGDCNLTASNRECYGYYTLKGTVQTAISYGVTVSENTVNIIPTNQKNLQGVILWGSYQIKKPDKNTLILTGPASYTNEKSEFRFQSLDATITLIR